MIVILLEPCEYRVPRGFLSPSPKKNDCSVNCYYSRYEGRYFNSCLRVSFLNSTLGFFLANNSGKLKFRTLRELLSKFKNLQFFFHNSA